MGRFVHQAVLVELALSAAFRQPNGSHGIPLRIPVALRVPARTSGGVDDLSRHVSTPAFTNVSSVRNAAPKDLPTSTLIFNESICLRRCRTTASATSAARR